MNLRFMYMKSYKKNNNNNDNSLNFYFIFETQSRDFLNIKISTEIIKTKFKKRV